MRGRASPPERHLGALRMEIISKGIDQTGNGPPIR